MEDKHRKIIQSNFSSLVERTDLDQMVTRLYEKGVFSDRMIEPYRDESRDARMRKRDLYMDITRRGPAAFQNLVQSLLELGYWDIALDLDPDSPYRPISVSRHSPESNGQYVSISDERRKTQIGRVQPPTPPAPPAPPAPDAPAPDRTAPRSDYRVVKSTHFFEEDSANKLGVYPTRGRRRGVLLVFNYFQFKDNLDDYRAGADLDCEDLKQVFSEIGFHLRGFTNHTKQETMRRCANLKESLVGYECLFVVVSSHGYSPDTEFRCSDGQLISCRDFLREFNNVNLSQLRGVPKVFIFQMCRGVEDDLPPEYRSSMSVASDAGPSEAAPAPRRWLLQPAGGSYSDMLIAHSTVPGYVSHREPERGSWYLQALCAALAQHAHDTDVDRLFKLADDRMRAAHPEQTSSVDSWGFNRTLYLYPGLFDDD